MPDIEGQRGPCCTWRAGLRLSLAHCIQCFDSSQVRTLVLYSLVLCGMAPSHTSYEKMVVQKEDPKLGDLSVMKSCWAFLSICGSRLELFSQLNNGTVIFIHFFTGREN